MMSRRQLIYLAAIVPAITWVALGQSAPTYKSWVTTFSASTAELLTLDGQGRIYVAGLGFANVPITGNAFASTPASPSYRQGYLLQLDPTGAALLYGTYLNGLAPKRIAVDPAGFMYVLADHAEPGLFGRVVSFPAAITPNAAQSDPGLVSTAVLLKIAPTGELVYGTYLGGLASMSGGLAVDSRGAATVCGTTADPFLPVSVNAVQARLHQYADAFITRISPDGSGFEALTYLGGAGADFCTDLRTDPSGNVYVYGDTNSRFFPVTGGAYQTTRKGMENLFVAKLDPDLTRLIWSTYAGSSGIDIGQSLTFVADGGLLLTGTTQSRDFPVTAGTTPPYLLPGPVDSSLGGMIRRPFLAILNPSGAGIRSAYVLPFAGGWLGTSDQDGPFYGVVWGRIGAIAQNATLNAEGLDGFLGLGSIYPFPSLVRFDPATNRPTYLGPLRDINGLNVPFSTGIAIDAKGNAVVAGMALPTYDPAGVPYRQLSQPLPYQPSSAVFSLDFSSEKRPLVTQVVNPASLLASPTAPGQAMQIFGLGLGSLDTTQVLIDGMPVPAISVASDSILATTPTSIASQTSFRLVVQRDGVSSDERTVPVSAVNPALFTAANTGSGQALATNEDRSANSPRQPARKGRMLRLLATGLGVVDSSGQPLAGVTADVTGIPASVQTIAPAVGYPNGYSVIDIVVPQGVPSGDFVPVRIKVNGVTSQPGVTVALR